jgi:hypothetical protein
MSAQFIFKQMIQSWMCQGVGLYLGQVTSPLKKTVAMDMEINCKNPTARA